MSSAMTQVNQDLASVEATLNYIGPTKVKPSFGLGNESSIAFDPHTVQVSDARPIQEQLSLDREGFALLKHTSMAAADPRIRTANLTHDRVGSSEINDAYHQEVAGFLQQLTGARQVIGMKGGLIVRTSLQAESRTWAPPAPFIHLDYVTSSAELFRDISIKGEDIKIAPYRRFAVYQTWRVLSQPPQDNTLAMCDGRSVPTSDAVVVQYLAPGLPGGGFDARMCKYRPDHRWYYFSSMFPDELLIFKGYDSDIPDSMNGMHTAFDNPNAGPNAVPRESIEARFLAFF